MAFRGALPAIREVHLGKAPRRTRRSLALLMALLVAHLLGVPAPLMARIFALLGSPQIGDQRRIQSASRLELVQQHFAFQVALRFLCETRFELVWSSIGELNWRVQLESSKRFKEVPIAHPDAYPGVIVFWRCEERRGERQGQLNGSFRSAKQNDKRM